MTDKVHNISDLPKDAPRHDEAADDTTVDAGTPGRFKNALRKHKMFLIGLGTGVGVGVTALAVAKNVSNEEDEVEETTPES